MARKKRPVGYLRAISNTIDDIPQFSSNIVLTNHQQQCLDGIVDWVKTPSAEKLQTFGGLGGSGKTTVLGEIARALTGKSIAYCCYTGKAASVLYRSLRARGVNPNYCGTIHRLIYTPVKDPISEETVWVRVENLPYSLIIIDEASMVSKEIMEDLQSYGIPILAVGDHGQLPPIGEDAGIMLNPTFQLNNILRQSLDNPIIVLAHLIRLKQDWKAFLSANQDPRIVRASRFDMTEIIMNQFRDFDQRPMQDDPVILCRTNKMRCDLNARVRRCLGSRAEQPLVTGERVICLKNHYFDEGLLANGFRGIASVRRNAQSPKLINLDVDFSEENMVLDDAISLKEQLGSPKTVPDSRDTPRSLRFDYGYALTVSKFQGSQADSVLLLMERLAIDDDEYFSRWAYTGVTRATKNLTVIV